MNIPYIETNEDDCCDCYQCLCHCNVKAIRFRHGHAQVVPNLCINCGMCIRVCPQKAKSIHSAMEDVQKAKKENRLLIASVAPSAPAYFHMKNFAEMEQALKELGFFAAEETSAASAIVGVAHQEYVENHPERLPLITSACPVIINLIQQYHSDLIPHLAPLVSPMIAHGRLLARKYGPDANIVFIEPCLAKRMEIYDKALSDVISAAITLPELEEWFLAAGLPYRSTPEAMNAQPVEGSRVFPLQGGLIGVSQDDVLSLDQRMAIASGLDDCQDVLQDIRAGRLKNKLVELMACKGGCGNCQRLSNPEEQHLNQKELAASIPKAMWPPMDRNFEDKQVKTSDITFEDNHLPEKRGSASCFERDYEHTLH